MSATRIAAPTGGSPRGTALSETLAEGLPVAHQSAVSRVDHRGDAIRLETARGTLTASRVIVTVPTSIIAGEIIRFDPPLADKLAAAAGLPLGVDDSSSFRSTVRSPVSSTTPTSSVRPPRGRR